MNILFSVPQDIILGPLLFLKFIADFFYSNYDLDFTNCAYDTTPYFVGRTLAALLKF